jgi:hypothetical protein
MSKCPCNWNFSRRRIGGCHNNNNNNNSVLLIVRKYINVQVIYFCRYMRGVSLWVPLLQSVPFSDVRVFFFFTKSLVIFSTVNSISFFFVLLLLPYVPFSSSPPSIFSPCSLSLSLSLYIYIYIYTVSFSHVNVCLQNLFPYCYNGDPPKLYRSRDRLDKSFLSLFCPLLAPPFTTSMSYFFRLLVDAWRNPTSWGDTSTRCSLLHSLSPFHFIPLLYCMSFRYLFVCVSRVPSFSLAQCSLFAIKNSLWKPRWLGRYMD